MLDPGGSPGSSIPVRPADPALQFQRPGGQPGTGGTGASHPVECTPEALAAGAVDRGVAGVILEAPFWSQGHVDVWREAGLSLMSGVCNSVDIARRVLAFGPDGFSSDRPHELRALLAADDAGRSPSVHLPARSGR